MPQQTRFLCRAVPLEPNEKGEVARKVPGPWNEGHSLPPPLVSLPAHSLCFAAPSSTLYHSLRAACSTLPSSPGVPQTTRLTALAQVRVAHGPTPREEGSPSRVRGPCRTPHLSTPHASSPLPAAPLDLQAVPQLLTGPPEHSLCRLQLLQGATGCLVNHDSRKSRVAKVQLRLAITSWTVQITGGSCGRSDCSRSNYDRDRCSVYHRRS